MCFFLYVLTPFYTIKTTGMWRSEILINQNEDVNKIRQNKTQTCVLNSTQFDNSKKRFFSAAGNETADDIIRSALFLHKNFVEVTPEDVIQLVSVAAPHQKGQDELMQSAAQHMVLTLYRNQLMHVFVRIAMVTISINACPNDTLDIGQHISLLLLEITSTF